MQATDALVLVMPEYNRGYNASLKNAIDYLYAEWEGLPVGCVGYGWHGASYAKSALRQTLERVKMTVVDGPGLEFGEDPHPGGRGPRERGRRPGPRHDVRRARPRPVPLRRPVRRCEPDRHTGRLAPID